MHEAHAFLSNLAMVLCVAAVATVVFQRLRQPVVLGYILAGLVVGPHLPVPLVADPEVVEVLAELGVTLLMFSIGLEFRLAKLLKVAPTGGLVALVEVSLMVWVGWLVGHAFGWTRTESLFTGAIVAISSTSIIAKAFEEQRVGPRRREVVFGILIVEDLLAILLMAALTIFASGRAPSAAELGFAGMRLGLSLLALLVVGLLVVPRAVRAIVGLQRKETTTVAAIGICFLVALATQALGYSVALGAFLAGMLVAESGHGEEIEHLVQPVRDVFAAVFFVAVGMMIDPRLVLENLVPVAVLTAVVIVGKVLAVSLGAFLVGHGTRASIQAGMSLAQIGEFSFILASLGATLGATRDFLYPVAIAVSTITTFTTPAFVRAADRVADLVDHKLPKPLQTLTALYGAWLEEVRSATPSEGTRARVRAALRLVLVDAVALLALAVAHHRFGAAVAREVAARVHVSDPGASLVVGGGALALAAVLLVGLVRGGLHLADAFAEPLAAGGMGTALRRSLVAVLRVAVLLGIGIPLVASTQPFVPTFGAGAVLLLVVTAFAGAVWGTATEVQGELRSGAQLVVDALRRHAALDAPAPRRLPALSMSGFGAPTAHRVGPDDHALGRTLVELNLRSRTGATVVAVAGSDGATRLPAGDAPLVEGEILTLAGTHEAVTAAVSLLRRGEMPAP